MLKCTRGFGLLPFILLIAAAAFVLLSTIDGYTQSLERTKNSYQLAEEKKQISNELKVILSNPQVCAGALQISGNTFSVGPLLSVDQVFRRFARIRSLQIMNSVVLPDGNSQSDFVITMIHTRDPNMEENLTVRATYQAPGGVMSTCRLVVNQKSACTDVGATWIESESRCDICERTGGEWRNGRCELSNL